MDNNAASKINNALFCQKPVAPNPTGDGDIDQKRPQAAECYHPTKTCPFHPCANDKGGGDDGGENGFNQAIELAAETLGNIKFIKEKKLISKYFDEISQDSGKYCFGVNDTLSCLEMGAIETLIVWEDLAVERCVLLNGQTQEEHIHFFTQEQQADDKNMKDPETGVDLELTDKIPMMEWLANEYKNFGCSLEFITDRSEEGSQFVRGFGGIGGILRYQVNLADFEVAGDHDDDSDEYSSDGEGYI